MKYLYKAKSTSGKVVTGSVNADNEILAEKILIRNNLVATSIVPAQQPTNFNLFGFLQKVNARDRAMFARQMATMISAGLTLPKAIKVATMQAKNDYVRSIYLDVYKDVEEGVSFSLALSRHPEAFDQVFVSVVGAGESTGKLDVVLRQMADQLENDENFVGKVKGALYYPAFILLAMIGIGVYMLIKVVPTLKGIFDAQGAELPIATRILLAMSTFMQSFWWLALLIFIGIVVFLKYFFDSESGAAIKDKLQINFPVIKKLYQSMYMYRLSQVLGMLLGAGVPLLNALKISATVTGNGVYEEALLNVSLHVEKGVPLSSQLLKEAVFPQLIGQMVAVGEETGQLDSVLAKVADYYKESTEQMIKTISTLIEPAIMAVMGGGVAFIVFAVLVPIYQISQIQN